MKAKNCEIWAIGGGKGGTGKSFITSSIGTYLASKGSRVVLIDADLGGANLHSFLGINRPKNSLTDFFDGNKVPLNEIIVECGIPGMGLVTGNLYSLDSDNIKYVQKLKFFRQIKALDTDYILLDLGAGSHNNTIDTFLQADKMIVVTVPEITAIENMYYFIKNVFFRRLKMAFGANGMKDILQDTWKKRKQYDIKNLRELVEYLMTMSGEIRQIVDRELSNFKVHIILNQLKNPRDANTGFSIRSVCTKFLGFSTLYSGFIGFDENVLRCINKKQPYMLANPFSSVTREIVKTSENLIAGRQVAFIKEEHAHGRLQQIL